MEDDQASQCTGRAITVTVNAMGVRDAVRVIMDGAGDIDFSSIERAPIDPDDVEAIKVGRGVPNVPGGFEARLLRVAYHSDTGSEVDSSYHIEELQGPGPFHQAPDMTSDHPDMTDVVRSSGEHSKLSADTNEPGKLGEKGRGGPRL